MSLQFAVDDLINPSVSLSYLSSEEDMEVDDPLTVNEIGNSDSDIEIIACFKEVTVARHQGIAGRCMSTEIPSDNDNLSILERLYGQLTRGDSVPSNELVELVLGNNPPNASVKPEYQQSIAVCSQLEPVVDSPLSPPISEQGPNFTYWSNPLEDDLPSYQPENPHIRGVAVSSSGICGNANQVTQCDCIVCGKSADTIKEEITFDYLERTHIAGESNVARLRRRNGFQARMHAGFFVLVPGECRRRSQRC